MNLNLNQWVIEPYFKTLIILTLFLLPILTMRSFTEDKRNGTFELLMTSPIQISELVLGKYIAVALVVSVMHLFALLFPSSLIFLAQPEALPIVIGFLGLLLFSLALTAIGIAISALVKTQAVAGVLSLVVFLLLYVVNSPAEHLDSMSAQVLEYLAPSTHTELLLKGVLDSSDLIYFLSLGLFGLFLANKALETVRIR